MNILITGPRGFIARKLIKYLTEVDNINIFTYDRHSDEDLNHKLSNVDCIFHLAGVNRAEDEREFYYGNVDLTSRIVGFLKKEKIATPIYYSSSIQALNKTAYGESKLLAENLLLNLEETNRNKVIIDRLCNIFGPGARPNYNSVVATFCYNIFHDLPLNIFDKDKLLTLMYVDDLIESMCASLLGFQGCSTKPIQIISVSDLVELLYSFKGKTGLNDGLSSDFFNKMYLTYTSYSKEILN